MEVIILWAVCAVLNYGFTFAHDQTAFPLIAQESVQRDKVWAAFFSILGPYALIATLITGGAKHGLKFSAKSK